MFKCAPSLFLTVLAGLFLADCGKISDPTGGFVSAVVPANNATAVPTGTKIQAKFSVPVDPTTLNTTTFQVPGVPGTVDYDGGSLTATFSPSAALPSGQRVTAILTTGLKDQDGAPLPDAYIWLFTTAFPSSPSSPSSPSTPPPSPPPPPPPPPAPLTVSAFSPSDGETKVPLTATLSATFSIPVDPKTLTAETLDIVGVSGTVTYNDTNRVATFIPAVPLAPETTYQAVVSHLVQGTNGQALSSDLKWSFTTGPPPIVPHVVSVTPPAGGVNVSVNTKVAATLSEPLLESTVTPQNVYLQQIDPPAAGTVSSTLSYATQGAQAAITLTPSSLQINTRYQVTITTGVQDGAGNPLQQPFVWTFTTTPLGVVSTSPAANATQIGTGTQISVTFSEPVDPTTITPQNFFITAPLGAVAWNAPVYNPQNATATLTAIGSLGAGDTFTVHVTTGIKDLAGNTLSQEFDWSFTTTTFTGTPVSTPGSADQNQNGGAQANLMPEAGTGQGSGPDGRGHSKTMVYLDPKRSEGFEEIWAGRGLQTARFS